MKRALIVLLFTLIFLPYAYSFAAEKNYTVESLFNLPEEKIDIGIVALILAKEIYPDVDIKAYSAKIDELVNAARILTKGRTDPDYRVRALNTFLYKIWGLKYDYTDPYGENMKNRLICGVIDSKKGQCVSMPLLYIAVAQRLGYPVYAVSVPDHFFVRYVNPNLKLQNIETTGGGGYSSNETYIRDFHISEQGIKSGAYLKTMSHRELLADLIAGNAIHWGLQGDIKKAINYLEHCAKMNPTAPGIIDNLGRAYLTYAKSLSGGEAEEYWAKGQSYKEKARKLGLVRLPREEYIQMVKEKAKAEAMSKGGKK